MQNIYLKNIKFASIKAILGCIASSKNISRAEISEKTDLSVVTVGKIVDALIDAEILKQTKAPRSAAGRRAGVLNINKQKYILTYDLTSYNFKANVIDLSLNIVETFEWKYDVLTAFSDNLRSFIKNSKAAFYKKYFEENCIGIGCSVPGVYDKDTDCVRSSQIPEMVVTPIHNIFEKYFDNNNLYVESNSVASGRINVENVDDYQNKDIIYLHVNERAISGAHYINGEYIGGKSNTACDFGRMIFDVDLTLDERIKLCKNENDSASLLAGVIYNLTRIISPHTFIFEFDVTFKTPNLISLIRECLIQKYNLPIEYIPELISAVHNISNSYCGLAIMIRNSWIRKMTLND